MSQVENPIPRPADDPERFLSHPDALYEMVDGNVVEIPPMGTYAAVVATLLAAELVFYLRGNPVGRVIAEGLFILDRDRDLRRRPDVAFLSTDRWPADRPIPEEGDIEAVPEIAIEVLSPNDPHSSPMRKLREYFSMGVRQVWLVDPAFQQISIYSTPTDIRIYEADDVIPGEPLLPGLRLAVAPLFQRTLR